MIHHHESARCPKCQRIESRVEICEHCSYRYPKTDDGLLSFLGVVATVGLVVVVLIASGVASGVALIEWIDGNQTLMQIVTKKLAFAWDLLHRIW